MTIGIDISSLQGPHRMRGIGYTLINFINNLPSVARKEHSFIFYAYDEAETALNLLDLTGMNYAVRKIKPRRRITKKLPGRLNMVVSAANQLIELRDLRRGDSRINDLSEVDVFLQTDQNQPLPRGRKLKKALILYDVIPYTLEWDYLWSYRTARKHGYSRKAAARVHVRRMLYAYKLRGNCHRADKLLAISEQTKQDFINLLGVRSKKLTVTPLGVSAPNQQSAKLQLHKYEKSSWGYMRHPIELKKPFVLFIGGADRRRRIDDLVAAFNQLRAQGHNFSLILAGDSMQGPDNIATEEIQYALKTSSYLEDIIFMGFVNDTERSWLYHHAAAYIFPSKYEGFGLPVLEAMIHGCPVISYRNKATVEVAGKAPVYADDLLQLTDKIGEALTYSQGRKDDIRQKGLHQARKFDWQKTSASITSVITS